LDGAQNNLFEVLSNKNGIVASGPVFYFTLPIAFQCIAFCGDFSRKCAGLTSGGTPQKFRASIDWRDSDTQRAAECPATVVRLDAVVMYKDAAEATIPKNGAPEFPRSAGVFNQLELFPSADK
jgi:hypothetical protein